MARITKTFLSGLVVVVPVLVALYLLVWVATGLESGIRSTLLASVPDRYYIPGAGTALAVVGIFLIGLAARFWLTRHLINGFDRLMRRIPLVSSIYQPTRDLMEVLGGDMTEHFGQVVLIRIPGTEMDTLGFVTRNDLKDLPAEFGDGDRVVVYVQWSSQIGGYCFVVPRSSVRPLSLTVEEGMRWALTAGISLSPGGERRREKGAAEPGTEEQPHNGESGHD